MSESKNVKLPPPIETFKPYDSRDPRDVELATLKNAVSQYLNPELIEEIRLLRFRLESQEAKTERLRKGRDERKRKAEELAWKLERAEKWFGVQEKNRPGLIAILANHKEAELDAQMIGGKVVAVRCVVEEVSK